MFFFISTDNIALDYLGGKCDYRSSFDKTDWYELFPNSKVFFTIILNNQYEFLPVNKLYRIRTSEFNFVKKEWFTEKNINDAMFFYSETLKKQSLFQNMAHFYHQYQTNISLKSMKLNALCEDSVLKGRRKITLLIFIQTRFIW